VGIGYYASRSRGVAGRLKETPEDFRVDEISNYPLPDDAGPFSVLRVRSQDWEQHELADALGRRLALPPHAVRWAGTKDRRAVTERLFSYRGAPPDGELGLRDVTLLEAYRARDGLVLGHHYGNAFRVRVTELPCSPAEAVAAYRGVEQELRDAGGFPNFFGLQRFGEVRPVTAEVGRELVRGDVAAAVDVYLSAVPSGGVPGPGDLARQEYASHRDPVRALREFPHEYRFERLLLDQLARGRPPERAFRGLSRELRLLFVHAYQSLLFNRWLTERERSDLSLDAPVDGDRLLRLERNGTVRSHDAIPVGADNRSECSDLVARGRGLVAGPLAGYESPEDPGRPGELFDELLAAEGVHRSDFRLPATPEIASRGAWRPGRVNLPPISFLEEPEAVVGTFALPRGAYATILLREFLKSGAT
jgi:tRNA pseudouridine13 synthase